MPRALPLVAILVSILLPWPGEAAGPGMRCQKAVARAGAKFARVSLKVSQRCAMGSVRGRLVAACRPAAGSSTGDPATDAAIARAARRLAARVAGACAQADLSAFARRCADASAPPLSVAELVTCLRDSHLDRVGAMLAVEFPGLAAHAEAGTGGCASTQICQCTCSSVSPSFLVPMTGDAF